MRPVTTTKLRLKAFGASVGLSLLFLLVYFWCNRTAATLAYVPTLNFDWERFIPFVPVMIVPYMSIDLFFVAAPFLCRTDRELATFSKRIIAAILIAGLCFLLFPFRFAFDRPPADGWLGAIFTWFRGLDQPFNLLPSLHIVFLVILTEHYWQHLRGVWRFGLNLWFILVGFSTLLTYQHHLLDVVTGFAVGVYCVYFIRESRAEPRAMPNRRVGFCYAMCAIGLLAPIAWLWPWGALLLWPALACGIVAAAYFGFGVPLFWKIDGRLHWAARIALAPCRMGQRISLIYYRGQCAAWNKITPDVWIGRVLNQQEAESATSLGVSAVLDLTMEFSAPAPFRVLVYRNIPVLDLTAPSVEQLREMAEFIAEESGRGIVYVHCKIGYSRAAAAVAAYLLQTQRVKSVPEAIDLLRRARPAIVVRPEVISALHTFARGLVIAELRKNGQSSSISGGPIFSSPGAMAPP